MPLPNIERLSPESIDDVIESLRCRYADDPISIINEEPIEYVLHLEALSCYYDDDVYFIFKAFINGFSSAPNQVKRSDASQKRAQDSP